MAKGQHVRSPFLRFCGRCSRVRSDFGAIFAELLPGNFAKLQPAEGEDLMAGLEFKVQLGSTWKQSLTELSGGQRSASRLRPSVPC
jgi:chromosome segregation ATPase